VCYQISQNNKTLLIITSKKPHATRLSSDDWLICKLNWERVTFFWHSVGFYFYTGYEPTVTPLLPWGKTMWKMAFCAFQLNLKRVHSSRINSAIARCVQTARRSCKQTADGRLQTAHCCGICNTMSVTRLAPVPLLVTAQHRRRVMMSAWTDKCLAMS